MVVCLALLALAVIAGGASSARAAVRRTPTLGPVQTTIDGPSPDIQSLDGMSVARDGTGAVTYVKDVGGTAHVFVSRLLNGTFQPAQQVDVGLPGPSSQPVIAADNGGLLLVAFINDGTLYAAQALSSAAPVGPPGVLFSGAVNPSLAISPFGKAYLAFTAVDASAGAVRTLFWQGGQWALSPTPLNANPYAAAGDGTDRPQVAAAGDGIGIVVWGESGHVYARRVTGTTPSTAIQQADAPSVDGFGEVSATSPVVSSVGYSTYAAVAYSETITGGGHTQTRVLYNRLHGEVFDGSYEADGTVTGGEGADQPQAAVTEFGAGFVTSELSSSHQFDAATLGATSVFLGVGRADSSANTAAPDAVPAVAGVYSTFLAWQQAPGVSGPAEIRLRYAPNGADLGPEQVISNPAYGPTDADRGLVAGGDLAGDAAVAYVQDTGAGPKIVAAQLYQTPGNFAPGYASKYYASTYPTMSWSTPAESWGPLDYSVLFDGRALEQTSATSIRTPVPVINGRHVWQVSATNQAGLTLSARSASLFVDNVAPRASLRLRGTRTVGRRVKVVTSARDLPPARRPSYDASGVASVVLHWRDGTTRRASKSFTATHVYRKPGTYHVTVTVTDRAGNHTSATRKLRIRARSVKRKPAPSPLQRRAGVARTATVAATIHDRGRSGR